MPKRYNIFFFVAVAAFLAGVGYGCTVDFDAEQSDVFPCANDDECLPGFECGPNDLCRSRIGGNNVIACVDEDGDGYGIGEPDELVDCPACEESRPNGCSADCNDDVMTGTTSNPGAGEFCDGQDNDCDEEVDEPSSCETAADCPTEGADYQVLCENSTCVYTSFNRGPMDPPECKVNFDCIGGAREPLPPGC